ncbi:reverse transcriptase domain-containing protein [Tanacetum coccineum]
MRPPSFPQPNVQNNQNWYNQNLGYNQNQGNKFNQGNQNYQAPLNQTQVGPLNDFSNYMRTNDVNMRVMQNQISNTKTELKNEFQTTMINQNNELKNMMSNELKNKMSSFFQMHSSSSSGSLPSNTVANSRGDLKVITTRSSVSYDRPTILTTSSPLSKEVEREPEATTTTSTPAYLLKITALTDAIKAMLLQNKTPSPAPVKAIEETCVTCGGLHPYYACLATDSNTFNASATTGTYNQGGPGYRPQRETNYRGSNQMRPPSFPQPNVQNNQNQYNQNLGYNQNRGNNFNQGNQNYQAPLNQTQVGPSNDFSNYMRTNDVNMRAMQNQISNMKTELKNEFQNTMMNQNNELKNMMHSFFQMHSPSGSGSLPSNTVANPRGDLKVITNQSGVFYDGPTIPTTSSPLPKEVEREPEAKKDKVQITSSGNALLHIPKFASTFKSLLSNKDKLFELENTPLNENSSVVLLKNLPEKLRDPGRFLIPCDFYGLESCMALADLGASIKLMPLSMWKELSLVDLTPTRMTFELATRIVAYPAGIAEDVCMQVGKFTFPADFVVADYDVNPRVPLILGRPFLRTAHALVDVHGEKLILRDGDEKLIFHADSTLKHPHKHGNESINMFNFIDITCEDRFPEVSAFYHEEFADELALLDSFPPGNEDDNFDPEADLRKIEYLINRDPSTESSLTSNIEIIDPILERFTNKHALVYSPPPGDDDDEDDDLFDLKSNNDDWKKFFDSTLPEESFESSEIATLLSSPFRNEDKVFNPCILILGGTRIFNNESKDKDFKEKTSSEALLILEERNFLSISSDQELLFPLELSVNETLLSFSSKNEDKVFNPGILISKGVHSSTLGLSY